MADAVQLAVLAVEAEDQRADGPLGLPRPPAHDDRVDRADPLDLHHADALAGPVRGRRLLGDDALRIVQPVLASAASDDGREIEGGWRARRLERGAALVVGQLEEHLVVAGEQVEREERRRRLLGELRDPRGGRVDALPEGVERPGDDDLAVEDAAAVGEPQLGEVAGQRAPVARLELDVVAVHERDGAEAVPLGLVGPAVAVGERGSRARELGQERRVERQGHADPP